MVSRRACSGTQLWVPSRGLMLPSMTGGSVRRQDCHPRNVIIASEVRSALRITPVMSISEKRLSLAILLLVVLIQAFALAPELSTAAYRNNDSVSHFALIKGMVEAVEHGDNPLDFWSAETSLGVPLARFYQPLARFIGAG